MPYPSRHAERIRCRMNVFLAVIDLLLYAVASTSGDLLAELEWASMLADGIDRSARRFGHHRHDRFLAERVPDLDDDVEQRGQEARRPVRPSQPIVLDARVPDGRIPTLTGD